MSRLAWVLLLLVAVDFSDPLLPGAVRLDPAESIQGVHTRSAVFRGPAMFTPVQPIDRAVPSDPGRSLRSDVSRGATIDRQSPRASRLVRSSSDEHSTSTGAEDH
jgi:hypothetical protein